MTIPEAVESRIADAPVSAHLATSVDDRPHVAPVWYGYRDGVLYFLTGGKKLANVRRNPRVAISLESVSDGSIDWNVSLLGTATVSDDPDRIEWASNWIYEKYDDGNDNEDSDDGEGSDDDHDSDDGHESDGDDLLPEEESDEHRETAGNTDEPRETDGGESADEERDYALVEVTPGSASINVYN